MSKLPDTPSFPSEEAGESTSGEFVDGLNMDGMCLAPVTQSGMPIGSDAPCKGADDAGELTGFARNALGAGSRFDSSSVAVAMEVIAQRVLIGAAEWFGLAF